MKDNPATYHQRKRHLAEFIKSAVRNQLGEDQEGYAEGIAALATTSILEAYPDLELGRYGGNPNPK